MQPISSCVVGFYVARTNRPLTLTWAGALVQWLKLPAEIAGSNPALTLLYQRNKMLLACSLVNIQYCVEPPRPRSSELGLKPLGFKFRILCLSQFSLYPHKGDLKPHSFHFIFCQHWLRVLWHLWMGSVYHTPKKPDHLILDLNIKRG